MWICQFDNVLFKIIGKNKVISENFISILMGKVKFILGFLNWIWKRKLLCYLFSGLVVTLGQTITDHKLLNAAYSICKSVKWMIRLITQALITISGTNRSLLLYWEVEWNLNFFSDKNNFYF